MLDAPSWCFGLAMFGAVTLAASAVAALELTGTVALSYSLQLLLFILGFGSALLLTPE